MKKNILIIIALFTIFYTNAQTTKDTQKSFKKETRFGIKGGLNIANQSFAGTGAPSPSAILGFNAGVFVEIKIANKLALQPELLYSSQGSKFNLDVTDSNGNTYNTDDMFKFNYINLPIMLKFYATKQFALEIGPQVGFLLSSDVVVKYQGQSVSQDIKKNINSNNFSINLGTSYDINPDFFVAARYSIGLTNEAKKQTGSDTVIKNNVISFSLGYKFK